MSSSERSALSDAHEYWLKAAEPRLATLCNTRDKLSPADAHARGQALAAESAAIETFLWKFKTSYNELQPVSQLPSEVLTYIFAIVETSSPVVGDERHDKRPSFSSILPTLMQNPRSTVARKTANQKDVDWLSITRVCRRWRKDALACSSLWSRMPLSMGTKGIHAFLSRSRNTSLIVEYGPGSSPSNLMEVMQAAHMPRMREIRIPAWLLAPSNGPLRSLLQNPAPHLEVISLRQDYNARMDPVTLPDKLLNNDSPRLHTFEVRQVDRWPAYPALFAKLRVFSVVNDVGQGYMFPLLSDMRHVLKSMPLLESLRLKNSMARGHDLTSDDGDVIMLPYLQELELSGPVTACSGVIRPLRVAAGCKILLVVADELTAMRDHAAALIDNLHATGFSIGFAPKSLSIAISNRQLHVAAFRESTQDPRSLSIPNNVSVYRGGPDLPSSTAFSFYLDISRQLSQRVTGLMVDHMQRLLAHALPTHAITSASVSAFSTPRDGEARSSFVPLWTTALAPCSRLAKLHAAGTGAHVLLRKLAESHPADVLLPKLSLLVFDEPQISRVQMFEGASLYDTLLAALQQRTIASVQIPESPLLNDAEMGALRALTDLQTYPRARTLHWAGDMGGMFDDVIELGDDEEGPGGFPDLESVSSDDEDDQAQFEALVNAQLQLNAAQAGMGLGPAAANDGGGGGVVMGQAAQQLIQVHQEQMVAMMNANGAGPMAANIAAMNLQQFSQLMSAVPQTMAGGGLPLDNDLE